MRFLRNENSWGKFCSDKYTCILFQYNIKVTAVDWESVFENIEQTYLKKSEIIKLRL